MSELTPEQEEAFLRQPTSPAPGITLALAIPTTASWQPERKASLDRLMAQLGLERGGPPDILLHDNKSDRHEWSDVIWTWGASTTATHFLWLQDDLTVAPNFWKALHALITALPDQLICLQSAHQAAAALCTEDVRLYTTIDGMLGPGGVIPRAVLEEFNAWRVNGLTLPAKEFPEGEDTLLGMFAMATGRTIWSPVPTLIDHPDDAGSNYGGQGAARRRPLVRWDMAKFFGNAWELEDLEAPGFWEGRFKRVETVAPDLVSKMGSRRAYAMAPEPPRHLGRFYENGVVPRLARQWVKGYSAADMARDLGDSGVHELRRLSYAIRGKGRMPTERLLVCTPVRGDVSPHYAVQLLAYQAMGDTQIASGFELLDAWAWSDDLVKVRSRFVYKALETDCTRILWLDADNVASAVAIRGMLQSGKQIVGCPYPRRDALRLERLQKYKEGLPPGTPLEALAYDYSYDVFDGALEPDETGCAKVPWFPLGCSLVHRSVFERMVSYFEELERTATVDLTRLEESHTRTELRQLAEDLAKEVSLWRKGHLGLNVIDRDPFTQQDHPMVALFNLMRRDSPRTAMPRLWGEDQSFCYRARDLGIDCWLYLGPGSPVSHDGSHLYRGHIEAFGFTRGPGAP